jgi:hypothetical protein
MKREKKEEEQKPSLESFIKKLGVFFSAISCFFLFVVKLSPKNIGIEKIDYFFSFIRACSIEISCLILVGLIIWKFESISKFINRKILKGSSTLKVATFIILFLFLLVNGISFYRIAKYRYKFYQNFNNFYKHDLYEAICEEINNGDYEKALPIMNELLSQYPHEGEYVFNLWSKLRNRVNYGRKFYNIYSPAQRRIKDSIGRYEYASLLKAYAFLPNRSHEKDLQHVTGSLNNMLNKASLFYNLVSKGNAQETISLYDQYGWFIFEDGINQKIRQSHSEEYKVIQEIIGNKSEDEFLTTIESQWLLEKARTLQSWKRELTLE